MNELQLQEELQEESQPQEENKNKRKKAGRPFDIPLLMQRHRVMLEFQKQIHPFTPTMQELMELWYGGDKENRQLISTTRYILRRMVENGLCVTRKRGKNTYYYAIEIQNTETEN